jgi:hypothetical protein
MRKIGTRTAVLAGLIQKMDHKVHILARGKVILNYDIGNLLLDVVEHPDLYGSKALEEISSSLGLGTGGPTTLLWLRQFAETWDRATVLQLMDEPCASGRYLETGHFLALTRVHDEKARDKLLTRIFQESLTVSQTEAIISAEYERKHRRVGGKRPPRRNLW